MIEDGGALEDGGASEDAVSVSAAHVCVSAHDCDGERAYIPYPDADGMTSSVEGDTSDADSNSAPASSPWWRTATAAATTAPTA